MSLEGFRNFAQGKGAKVVLGLIALPFAFFGIDSYIKNGDKSNAVATVAGESISQTELDNAIQNQKQYLKQTLGNAADVVIGNPAFNQDVLNKLIERKVLLAEAKHLNFGISDAQIMQMISTIPTFQDNGVFSQTKYEQALKAQNIEVKEFESMLRQDLMLNAMQIAIADSTFTSNKQVEQLIKINEQKRELSIYPIDVNQFMANAKVEDKEITDFYTKNQKKYVEPQRVKLDYVLLSADEMAMKQAITPQEVETYYKANPDKLKTQEERKASHILLPKEQKAEAEKLLAELKAKPADFAEKAKKLSKDPGSAEGGGDLGFFGKGVMTPNFEKAVFAMKPEEIRLVDTEFGWHIIQLKEIKAGKLPSLEEAKPTIETELKRQKALVEYNKLAERYSKLASEKSTTLQPLVDELKLKIEHTELFAKDHPPAGSFASHPKVLEKAFNPDFLKAGKNSEPIEITPNTLIVLKVAEQKPTRQLPLEEVKDNITKILKQQKALEQAKSHAKTLVTKIQAGEKIENLTWSKPQLLQRQEALRNGLNEESTSKVFAVPFKDKAEYVVGQVKNGMPIIVKVSNVVDVAEVDENKRKMYAQQVNQLMANENWASYLKNLKSRHEIKILKDRKDNS